MTLRVVPERSSRLEPARRRWWQRIPLELPGVAGVTLAGGALAGVIAPFQAQSWSLWVIYGLLAVSFTFVWGHAGIFSFGQSALFGVGGYAYAIVGINVSGRTGETLSALAAGVLVAALAAAALGYFMFYGNVGDVYVAIITLAVTLVLLHSCPPRRTRATTSARRCWAVTTASSGSLRYYCRAATAVECWTPTGCCSSVSPSPLS
ncbi:ABC transporter permease subunit [Dactylosporangium darangshiense]|uniref:ABC transporter permease subunit n=1 Tax=Dactylosporangium darangshiense TaxID=579108 RepID=UPI0036318276